MSGLLGPDSSPKLKSGFTGQQQTAQRMGFSCFLSTDKSVANDTMTEIGHDGTGTWTELFEGNNNGMDVQSGRFTPRVAGVYHCGYLAHFDEQDDTERIIGSIRKNGGGTFDTEVFGYFANRATGTDDGVSASSSNLIYLDADDYVSVWMYQDTGGTINFRQALNQKFWGYWIGT